MTESNSSPSLSAFSDELANAIERASPSIVAIGSGQRGAASGVLWQPNVVVTTEFAVKHEDEIRVQLASGETVTATLVGRDAGTDLAVLRLESGDLPAAPISQTPLRVGNLVLAIARDRVAGISVSLGTIGSLGDAWSSWQGGQIDQFIRPSLLPYPGFAGGALLDVQGQAIGINTTAPRGMALTIPATTVTRVVNQLLQTGRVARGYLGVGMQAVRLPEALQQAIQLPNGRSPNSGVVLLSVEPDSPAAQAGWLIGDILVMLGDRPIRDASDVQAMLNSDRVGQGLTAQLIRGGALIELSITVGERPWSDEPQSGPGDRGERRGWRGRQGRHRHGCCP